MNYKVDRMVAHWALRATQNLDAPPKERQQCATMWIEDPDVISTPEYIGVRARQVDLQLLDIFGRVDADRKWMIGYTPPLPLYKESDDQVEP